MDNANPVPSWNYLVPEGVETNLTHSYSNRNSEKSIKNIIIRKEDCQMGKALSNEEFTNRIVNKVGTEYSFLEPYAGRHTKILCRHNVCGYEWKVEAGAFLGNKNFKGSRCPKCCPINNHQKSDATFKKQVTELTNGEYEAVSKYKNARTPVSMLHKKCGNIVDILPYSFMQGVGCWHCNGGHTYVAKEVPEVVKERTLGAYEVISKYTGYYDTLLIKHVSCGAMFESSLQQIMTSSGVRCHTCFGSHGEANVASWLSSRGISYIGQKSFKGLKYKSLLSYDFFIPEDNTLIEYQGYQHYYPVKFFGGEDKFKMQQESDRLKREYAKDNGYKLITIPYTYNTPEAVYDFLSDNYQ